MRTVERETMLYAAMVAMTSTIPPSSNVSLSFPKSASDTMMSRVIASVSSSISASREANAAAMPSCLRASIFSSLRPARFAIGAWAEIQTPRMRHKPAHVGCEKIFLDLPVHTPCTRRLLTD